MSERRPIYRQLAWMIAIWTLSVGGMALVSVVIRWCIGLR